MLRSLHMQPVQQASDKTMNDKTTNRKDVAEFTDYTEEAVPLNVIKRLPRYYRYLRILLASDVRRVSSRELASMMHLTASQIRQDFSRFGGFGQQGYGYNVKYLYKRISELLGVSAGLKAVIIGAGNLGSALAHSSLFERRGIRLAALFDNDPQKLGAFCGDIEVLSVDKLEGFIDDNKINIAVLTLPGSEAENIAKRLAACGIGGIWNFTNSELVHEVGAVALENVHLGDSLMTLCYNVIDNDKKNRL